MRYVVAMVFAVIGAGLAAVFLSSQVADWVVSHQAFDSPDDADSLHMAVYMASNVGGLIVGWLIGWVDRGREESRQAADLSFTALTLMPMQPARAAHLTGGAVEVAPAALYVGGTKGWAILT